MPERVTCPKCGGRATNSSFNGVRWVFKAGACGLCGRRGWVTPEAAAVYTFKHLGSEKKVWSPRWRREVGDD